MSEQTRNNDSDRWAYVSTDEEQLGMAIDENKLEIREIPNQEADRILEKHVELAVDPWSKEFADFADKHRDEKLFYSDLNPRVSVIFSLRSREGVWISTSEKMHAKGRVSDHKMGRLRELAKRRGLG
jgi:hypothetical protein